MNLAALDLDRPARACEGCGFCCKKAPCSIAPAWTEAGCSALVWDAEANRYWCGLVLLGAPEVAEALYVGAGCCCGLNSDRRNVR